MESAAPEPVHISPPLGRRPRPDNVLLHAGLFLLALLTTTLAGAELVSLGRWFPFEAGVPQLGWADLWKGLPFAVCFLAFLATHEFGHYFAARHHRVGVSLPYFLPVFVPYMLLNIGSLGAVIRLRDRPDTRQKFFDIGIAGPLAGAVVAILVLIVGFVTLPGPDYLLNLHPEYERFGGGLPSDRQLERLLAGNALLAVGDSLLFRFLAWVFAEPALLPSRYELYHYPVVFAGYITLFFTALNLLPVGQLDGGHIVYGLLGRERAAIVSRLTVLVLMAYGGIGLLRASDSLWLVSLGFYLLYLAYLMPQILGSTRWWAVLMGMAAVLLLQLVLAHVLAPRGFQLVWLIYAFMLVRFMGLDHPPALVEAPLDRRRQVLGWLALALFVLCFTPEPMYVVEVLAGDSGAFVLGPAAGAR